MRVQVVDPSAFTPPYDRSLCAALARAGAEVELLTSPFSYGPVPPADGYRVEELLYRRAGRLRPGSRLRLPLKAAEHLPGMLRLRRRTRAADLVHYQWLTAPALDGALIGRRARAVGAPGASRVARARRAAPPPRVFTLHYPLPGPVDRRGLARQRRLLSRFDAVIAHTDHGARRLVAEVGLDPAAVRAIPHGPLDYLTRLPEERPLPSELAAVEGPVILFFGLLRPYKGIDVLLEAFREVEGAELWVAGMPRMELGPLRELAARAPGTVRFVPRFIADPEIPAYLRRAEVVVLPYRRIEQSGVLYAALAFGKPLVLSDVGGFAEVGRETGAARLVAPGDPEALAAALRELLADPGARTQLAAGARAAAAGPYSWERIAERTLALYRELLGEAG